MLGHLKKGEIKNEKKNTQNKKYKKNNKRKNKKKKEKKERKEELKPKTWKGNLSSKGGYPSRKPEKVAWMNKHNQQIRVDLVIDMRPNEEEGSVWIRKLRTSVGGFIQVRIPV